MSYHGAESRNEIKTEVNRRGFKKAFSVTDKDMIKFGVTGEIEKVLAVGNIPYEIFSELKANPTVKLAIAVFNDVCTSGNPRVTSVKEIETLYRKAY